MLEGHGGPRTLQPPAEWLRGAVGRGTREEARSAWVPGVRGAWGTLPRWAPRQGGLGAEAEGCRRGVRDWGWSGASVRNFERPPWLQGGWRVVPGSARDQGWGSRCEAWT